MLWIRKLVQELEISCFVSFDQMSVLTRPGQSSANSHSALTRMRIRTLLFSNTWLKTWAYRTFLPSVIFFFGFLFFCLKTNKQTNENVPLLCRLLGSYSPAFPDDLSEYLVLENLKFGTLTITSGTSPRRASPRGS